MHSKFKEKVAICYSCSGESYRESALKNLQDYYFDDENLHYFIITDDKSYFDGVQRKNLVVNELKDFYEEFPLLEKYEATEESIADVCACISGNPDIVLNPHPAVVGNQ